jgi:hypothetical protein
VLGTHASVSDYSGSISSKKYDPGATYGDISSDIKCKKEEDILINILLATEVIVKLRPSLIILTWPPLKLCHFHIYTHMQKLRYILALKIHMKMRIFS